MVKKSTIDEATALLENIWGKRERGLDTLAVDWKRPISREDIQYLLDRYPYLQMINTEATFSYPITIRFVRSDSGWVMHDYGDAICASPGDAMYGKGPLKLPRVVEAGEEDEGGEGGGEGEFEPGQGTIVKQAVDTARDMIDIAVEHGWAGVQIVYGHELMKWAAWSAAEEHGLALQGYTPDDEARAKHERLRKRRVAAVAAPKPG